MPDAHAGRDRFVTPGWLHDRIGTPGLSVIDGSWHLAAGRDAFAEYREAHLPGAVFFDLDAVADRATDLPHMLPTPAMFAEAAGAMGTSDEDTIVVYDTSGLFSAPRVAWTFRAMGAADVRILEGGLPAWRGHGLPLDEGITTRRPARFHPQPHDRAVVAHDEMRDIVENGRAAIIDARPLGRFRGIEPEPRPGLRAGHMPGAKSLPASQLTVNGKLLPPEALRELFAERHIVLDRPMVTTCGSGVTAALLALALEEAGATDVRVYDGSWAEWGREDGGPVVSAAARGAARGPLRRS